MKKSNLWATAAIQSLAVLGAGTFAAPVYAQTASPSGGSATDVGNQPSTASEAPANGATPTPASPADSGSEIVVTGSRIARPDLVASSPVAVISGEALKQVNAVTVEQILAANPQFTAGFGQSSNNPGDGSATVNLRNLGTQRTLVLIDGKRAPSYDTGGTVDVNSIPTALIKRIDILTGGASAVYGSDAIAGVVNFILDDRFKGLTADASSQITGQGDGAEYNASLTGGVKLGDRGNLIVSGGYSKREGVFYAARPELSTAISSYDLVSSGGSSNTIPTAFDVPGAGRQQIQTDGSLRKPIVRYNFNPVNYAQSPFRRINVMALGRYELGDHIEAYGRANYSDNKVTLTLASTATAGFPFNIDPTNPFLSAAERNAFFNTTLNPGLQINDGTGVAGDPTARAGTSTIGIRRRIVETGGRIEEFRTKNKQVVGGFRGDLGGLKWDVSAQYGESKKNSLLRNDLSYTALVQALDVVAGPGGAPACFDPSNGCVPLNLFNVGVIPQSSLAFVLRDAHSATKTSQFIAGGNIGGDISFLRSPLAHGAPAFSVGAEYRKEKGSTAVDPLYASGDLIYYGQGQNIKGAYSVKEVYGELKVPLVQERPGFYSLGIELGGRYSHYSTVGNVKSYKFGGDYAPVQGVRFRSIYQRAVRAPNIYELFSPSVAGTGGLGIDPCAGPNVSSQIATVCYAQGAPAGSVGTIPGPISGQINIFTGGNPRLQAEKSDTFTAGVVLNPPRLRGFTASLDYFNIRIKNAVSTTSPFLTVQQCYSSPSTGNPACTGIIRNPIDGSLSGPTQVGVPAGLGNVAAISTKGLDINVGYRAGSNMGFHYGISLAGTYTKHYKFQGDPNSTANECAGFFGPVCDYEPLPKWKHVVDARVGWKTVSFLTRWRYLGAIKADTSLSGPDGIVLQRIRPYSYFDETINFDISNRFSMRLGVLNAFDKKPPIVGDTTGSTAGAGSTFPNTYDVLGRSFFAGVTVKL